MGRRWDCWGRPFRLAPSFGCIDITFISHSHISSRVARANCGWPGYAAAFIVHISRILQRFRLKSWYIHIHLMICHHLPRVYLFGTDPQVYSPTIITPAILMNGDSQQIRSLALCFLLRRPRDRRRIPRFLLDVFAVNRSTEQAFGTHGDGADDEEPQRAVR